MRRLLIANRGEIAVRIARACWEAGISPIAVFSEADRHALHVSLADRAVCIGDSPAAQSYLCVDALLNAARITGADALHPGYGFLAENADFAAACAQAGITFVGPPPEVIRLLGDKMAARELAASVGVPTVPGYQGADQSDARLLREARSLGIPLLIKAAAGGGGRGIRAVSDLTAFESLLAEARREALAAFGDDRVFLERHIRHPRHIEFQILGDRQGAIVPLFERECSIQRRRQKLLEESPSPLLSPALRACMADAAVAIARAAGYVNAGTVEFLVETPPDSEPTFYFLEVNTRLQVEHPVTELVTGRDIVQLQLRIADGNPLPFTREQAAHTGHAIEARINAENCANGFLPSTGEILTWEMPEGPGIRVDSGVARGSVVTPYYDSLLAKLIVFGESREAALARMEDALQQCHVLGVETNIPYLLDIVRHPAFRAGELSTDFLSEQMGDWRPDRTVPSEVLLALAFESLTAPKSTASAAGRATHEPDPWHGGGRWRNG